MSLAKQPCPPQQLLLAQQCGFRDWATAWLERQGWLWGGVGLASMSPGAPNEVVPSTPAPSLSIFIPQHCPTVMHPQSFYGG